MTRTKATTLLIAIIGAVGLTYWSGHRPLIFDPVRWRANGSTLWGPTDRQRMVANLLAKYSFPQMRRDSVLVILGPASNGLGPLSGPDNEMRYELGPTPGWISLEADWLILSVNADNTIGVYDLTTN